MVDVLVEIDAHDVGNGERLVWYSLEGFSSRQLWDARPAPSKQVIVHEVPGEPPGSGYLCHGMLSWDDAYHYFAGCATGFAIARGLKSE